VDQEKSLDSEIQECLTRLGIGSPVEWDVLAFVYRHQASLTNADQIGRMLGYPSTVVADALDHMEALKLMRRSRASQGVRLYRFGSEADLPSHNCFQQLITLTETPAGRLVLIKRLRQLRTNLSLAKKGRKSD
jgi:MarR family